MQQGVSKWDKGQCSTKCYQLYEKQQDINQCYAKCLKDHDSELFQSHSQEPTFSEMREKSENYDGMDSFM